MNHTLVKTLSVLAMLAVVMSCRRPEDAAQRATTAASRPGGGGGAALTVGAPTPESLTQLLGVQVDAAPGEINQYLIRAGQGSVDLTKVGKIHQDLGYAVGVTLSNGTQIGFRYDPPPGPPAEGPAAGEQKK